MKNLCFKKINSFFTTSLILFILAPVSALAASLKDAGGFLSDTGGAVYNTDTTSLPEIIGTILNYILGFLGVIFLILTIYGGFLWMTAGGNEDQIKKGRKYLTNSIIGLAIVLAAYSLTFFVVTNIIKATGQ